VKENTTEIKIKSGEIYFFLNMKGWTGATLGKIKHENVIEQKKKNKYSFVKWKHKWLRRKMVILLNGLDKGRLEKMSFFTNGRDIDNRASFKTWYET
jgi:hypothetical protein